MDESLRAGDKHSLWNIDNENFTSYLPVLWRASACCFAISAASPNCCAVIVYFDGSASTDFLNGTNWTPDGVPGNNLVDIYSIDDGLSSTFSGGNTFVNGLRVGSTAKEHQLGETHFGRLTMTGGSLGVIGSNLFEVGRERENVIFGGDYNKNWICRRG